MQTEKYNRKSLQGIMINEKYLIPKSHVLYNFTYLNFLKWQNHRNCEHLVVVREVWFRGELQKESGCGYKRAKQEILGVMELFCIFIVVMDTQSYTSGQIE